MKKKFMIGFFILIIGCIGVFLLMQIIPYGKDHSNPPVVSEPNWDSPKTRAYAQRACFDCHSNETTWPWYSSVAPVSWLVQLDVDRGRRELNFSDWSKYSGRRNMARRLVENVQNGEMPPFIFIIQHPDAKLSTVENDEFINGMTATFSQ
jgi:hypothetical protein